MNYSSQFLLHTQTGRSLLYYPRRRNNPAAEKPPVRASERSPQSWILSPQMSFHSKPHLPTSFFYQSKSLSFLLQTCLWFATVCKFRIAILLLLPNKLIFLVKSLAVLFLGMTIPSIMDVARNNPTPQQEGALRCPALWAIDWIRLSRPVAN